MTSTATPDDWSGVHDAQFLAAEDYCGSEWAPDRGVGWFVRNIRRYLPPRTEFHGVLLVNNVLTLIGGCSLGIRPEVAEFVALSYTVGAFLLWGAFVLRHAGLHAYVFFAGLFVFPPPKLVTTSMFLMGSHVEGAALCAAVFWMAFRSDRSRHQYGIFATAGVLFFLYKPTVFPLLVLLPWMWLRLGTLRRRCWAGLFLLIGFAPMAFFAAAFGFRGHHLQDEGPDLVNAAQAVTWWNVLSHPTIRVEEVWASARSAFDSGGASGLWGSVYLFAVLLCSAILLMRMVAAACSPASAPGTLVRDLRPAVWAAVLAFPALQCVFLSLSVLPICERYFLPLYPVTMVVIAVAVATLPRRVAVGSYLALLALLLYGNVSYLRDGPWSTLF